MLPVLRALGRTHQEMSVAAIEDEVAKALRISPDDRARMQPSGNHPVFASRLNWARSYLTKACLVEMPRRGHFRATERGRALLAEGPEEIELGALERYPEFVAWRAQTKPDARTAPVAPLENPETAIAFSVEVMNAELAEEIVNRVHALSPAFFERLIIDLEF